MGNVDWAGERQSVVSALVSGFLEREDFNLFAPVMRKYLDRKDGVRVLLQLDEFNGWRRGALWEPFKPPVELLRHVERLAIVGRRPIERDLAIFFMAKFTDPVTASKTRYFDVSEMDEARAWIEEDWHAPAPHQASQTRRLEP